MIRLNRRAGTASVRMEKRLARQRDQMGDFSVLVWAVENPACWRTWLLYKASETLPLDRALDLARAADQFVKGSPCEATSEQFSEAAESLPVKRAVQNDQPPKEPPANSFPTAARPKLTLSPEAREKLLDGLAAGARNAELAQEFGLSMRQVQGIRISQARLAKLGRAAQEPPAPQQTQESIDEVVRFLRQQDDVVVRQANGDFLVNGRFRLAPTELYERANRIRARNRKPSYAEVTVIARS